MKETSCIFSEPLGPILAWVAHHQHGVTGTKLLTWQFHALELDFAS